MKNIKFGNFVVSLKCLTCGNERSVDTSLNTSYLYYAGKDKGPELGLYESGGCETCSTTEIMIECTDCGSENHGLY